MLYALGGSGVRHGRVQKELLLEQPRVRVSARNQGQDDRWWLVYDDSTVKNAIYFALDMDAMLMLY